MKEQLPATGFNGILRHWKNDLSAAVSVSLVALPLALGIAIASGAPPMSGILAAIIGGVVTTFFRGSHVAINGPAAGLIVVVLAGVESMADENGSGFPYVLAAIVIAGIIQAILGILKMGKLGDMFPASVVNGMLATIGITIFVKQFNVALGVKSGSGSIMEAIFDLPETVVNFNPLITFIAIISLAILIIHPRLQNKFLRSIPAPLLVLVVSIPLVFLFNLVGSPEKTINGIPTYIGQEYLINIPDKILDGIIFPDFSKITEPVFWLTVISIMLVASIETLISTKAVDKLDRYKRRTNLNKDLFAVGLTTAVAGFLGGLPIITVIVRSSVNVNHNAKTKWSNFYHGVLLLLFVFLFPFIINEIPLASLAAILVYTGFKLASPQVFKNALLKGWEQLLILISTTVASLATDLLWGILFGVFVTLLIHWSRSQLSLGTFVRHMANSEVNVVEESEKDIHVEIKGIANFAIILKLINSLERLSVNKHFIVNFSRTKLVDSTLLDFVLEHREKYFTKSEFEFIGLDVHKTSSPHPLALHVLEKPMQKRLTGRQNDLYHFAQENNYKFHPEINWDIDLFENFKLLKFHINEYHRNRVAGKYNSKYDWEISDLTYNDGILMAREEHHITVMVIHFPAEIVNFSITKKSIKQLKTQTKFEQLESHSFDKLKAFLLENELYYLESIGEILLIYRRERLLSAKEVIEMHEFAKRLCFLIPEVN